MTIEPSTWLRIEFISFYIVLVCCFFSRQVESSHLNESFYGLDCTHLRIRLMNDEHCYIFPEKRVRGKKIYNKKKQRKETEEKKQQFIWNQRREISIDLCSLNQVNAGGLDTFILIFLFIYFFLPISFFPFRFVSTVFFFISSPNFSGLSYLPSRVRQTVFGVYVSALGTVGEGPLHHRLCQLTGRERRLNRHRFIQSIRVPSDFSAESREKKNDNETKIQQNQRNDELKQ